MARRLYSERAALRYDGVARQIRMADVIELTHPRPTNDAQSALFSYLLDRRHHDDGTPAPTKLPVLAAAAELGSIPMDDRRPSSASAAWPHSRARASPGSGSRAGFREAWTRSVGDGHPLDGRDGARSQPAELRRGRHLEASVEAVITKISDAEKVERARLFPYQVWAAYKNAPSDNWRRALGTTLEHTITNVPVLDGTLIVIDTSGSMQMPVSNRSKLQRVEVAAVMAMATAKRERRRVVIFGQGNARVDGLAGTSVLGGVARVIGAVGSVAMPRSVTAPSPAISIRRHRRS